MKRILVTVLWLATINLYFSDAKWCIQETTINTEVTRLLSKTITVRKYVFATKTKTVWYTVTEMVPRVKQRRVCCKGYALDATSSDCEPICASGCSEFAECVRPNTCECIYGYHKKGDGRCEPNCAPSCTANGFCTSPYVCQCNSGFEYNYSTRSCDPTATETRRTILTSTTAESTRFVVPSLDESSTTSYFMFIPRLSAQPVRIEFEAIPRTFSTTTEPTPTETPWTPSISSTRSHDVPSLDKRSTILYVMDISTEKPFSTTLEPPSVETTRTSEMESSSTTDKTSDGYHDENSTKSGFKSDDCIEDKLCSELTVREYKTTPELSESRETSDLESVSSSSSTEDVSTNCDYECLNGFCMNGVCQCFKGQILIEESNMCVNISCDTICHNGTCSENGVCECHKGFTYHYRQGCVPFCDRKCINGSCIAPGICKCHVGFQQKSENMFECIPIPVGKLSEKLEKYESRIPWIWVLLLFVMSVAVFGLFAMKKLRKHDYNVNKIEKQRHRHVVQFVCEEQPN